MMPGDSDGAPLPQDGIDHISGQPPTNTNLTGPDHDTDYEWHRSRMQYISGWASDPLRPQSKQAKPTHTDPEDDRRSDLALPKWIHIKDVGSSSRSRLLV